MCFSMHICNRFNQGEDLIDLTIVPKIILKFQQSVTQKSASNNNYSIIFPSSCPCHEDPQGLLPQKSPKDLDLGFQHQR